MDFLLYFWSLALVNAVLAQMKGMNTWFWFIISLFIGPVVTICILFDKGHKNRNVKIR
ncbi:hypothetical protein [Chengkuizengella marina]|uniref:hypothetical protein n=1 Tax=Chengkuizengella marina TaxID=2507566 RepID=UPI00191BF801|nr:hypothetical protein [Chengkuizengella marina]